MRFNTLASVAALLSLGAAPAFADHHGGQDEMAEEADIVDTAVAAGEFETLAAALDAAGLVEALKGDGPFTVFAPTDDAFGALPEGTVETLLEEENADQLNAVLTYHVVPGEYLAADLDAGEYELETLQGSTVDVVVGDDGAVTVDGANVTTADVEASNGVIHIIDAVIMPE